MHGQPRKIRVIHVASGDLWGGAEAQIAQLLPALARESEIDLSAVLLNHGPLQDRLADAKIATSVIDETRLGSVAIFAACLRHFRRTRPDVVHTHRSKENVVAGLAGALAGVKIGVRTVHGAPEFQHSIVAVHKRAIVAADAYVAQKVQSHIIAVSADLADSIKKRWPHANVGVIENGLSVLKPISQPVQDSSRYHVGFFGRLVPVKRVDVFLRAAAVLVGTGLSRFQFHIVGDGPLRSTLEQDAVNLGIAEHCKFHGFESDALSAIASMDCIVLTSDHEGLPMIALEAISLGIPVIAHAVGGLVTMLQSVPGCTLVANQEPAEFARHVAETCNRRSGALISLPARYRIERTANEYAALYRAAVGSHEQAHSQ